MSALSDLREALKSLRDAKRIVICHPDMESQVRDVITENYPYPGLVDIVTSEAIEDKIIIVDPGSLLANFDANPMLRKRVE